MAPDGILAMDYEIEIDESMPEPLRIGLQGQVDSRLSNVTYFGLALGRITATDMPESSSVPIGPLWRK